MDFSVIRNLTIQFTDDEIDVFLGLLIKMNSTKSKIGFIKDLNKDELELVKGMHSQLISEDETDTN